MYVYGIYLGPIPILKPKYIPYNYMDPLGKGLRSRVQRSGSRVPGVRGLGVWYS